MLMSDGDADLIAAGEMSWSTLVQNTPQQLKMRLIENIYQVGDNRGQCSVKHFCTKARTSS